MSFRELWEMTDVLWWWRRNWGEQANASKLYSYRLHLSFPCFKQVHLRRGRQLQQFGQYVTSICSLQGVVALLASPSGKFARNGHVSERHCGCYVSQRGSAHRVRSGLEPFLREWGDIPFRSAKLAHRVGARGRDARLADPVGLKAGLEALHGYFRRHLNQTSGIRCGGQVLRNTKATLVFRPAFSRTLHLSSAGWRSYQQGCRPIAASASPVCRGITFTSVLLNFNKLKRSTLLCGTYSLKSVHSKPITK